MLQLLICCVSYGCNIRLFRHVFALKLGESPPFLNMHVRSLIFFNIFLCSVGLFFLNKAQHEKHMQSAKGEHKCSYIGTFQYERRYFPLIALYLWYILWRCICLFVCVCGMCSWRNECGKPRALLASRFIQS